MRDRLITQECLLELRDMAQDGAAEDAPFELSCREMLQLLDHVDILGAALDVEAGDYCRVCGCTENIACPEICHWVAEGLCSSCQHQVEEADDGEGFQVRDLLTGELLGDEQGAIIYLDRRTAGLSALQGVALYQVGECQSCGRRGRYPEEAGSCPSCGGEVRGLDEYRAVDGRALGETCEAFEFTNGGGDGIAVLTLDQVADGGLHDLLGELP